MTDKSTPYKAISEKVVEHFGTHLALAQALGYQDLRNVSAWATGMRRFPPQHCVAIEQKSQGKITRKDLRPDWQKFWPELAHLTTTTTENQEA